MTTANGNASPPHRKPHHLRRPQALGRVAFAIAEAARALGMRPDALRRLVERHAVREGDETIARLSCGIVARKRVGMARWLVTIPAELRAAE